MTRLQINSVNGVLLLLLVAVAGYFLINWSGDVYNFQRVDYECQAVFRLETPDLTMPAVAGISVMHNKGSMMLGGPVYQQNIFVGAVNRRFEFNVEEDDTSALFKINNTIKFEKDNLADSVADDILPGFLTVPKVTIYFKVTRVKEGIFFMRDNRPLFYCQYL